MCQWNCANAYHLDFLYLLRVLLDFRQIFIISHLIHTLKGKCETLLKLHIVTHFWRSCPCRFPSSMVLWVMVSVGDAVSEKMSCWRVQNFPQGCPYPFCRIWCLGFPDLPLTTSQLPPTGGLVRCTRSHVRTRVSGPVRCGILKEAVLCLDACQTRV